MRFENLVFWRYHFGFMPDWAIELWLWSIAALVAFVLWRARACPPALAVRVAAICNRLRSSIVLSAATPLIVRAVMCRRTGIPIARIHDEWSQLFAAQTFELGRLTNPTPRLWQHFETFHINMVPSYQSMYLPGHALVLALGHLLFRHEWFGCWIEVALLAGAVCWTLQAAVPAQWALLGGLFCGLRFGTFSYWMNGYHGGALIAAGGALLTGAYLHSRKEPSARTTCIGAIGLVLLGFARPYEGALFAAPIMVAWISASLHHEARAHSIRVFLPPVAIVVAAVCWLGYYNYRGTGHALRFAYVENQQQYHITNALWMQKLPASPQFRHAGMQQWAESQERQQYRLASTWRGRLELLQQKITTAYIFYLFPGTVAIAVGIWVAWRDRSLRILVVCTAVLLAGIALELWVPQSHYFAPMTAALVTFFVLGLQRLTATRYGSALALVVLCLCFGNLALEARAYVNFIGSDAVQHGWNRERVKLERKLSEQPGKQLVIVRYTNGHIWHQEWVYNQPDIESAKVIWTRDMGDKSNAEVLQAYPERNFWLLEPDQSVPSLSPLRLTSPTLATSGRAR